MTRHLFVSALTTTQRRNLMADTVEAAASAISHLASSSTAPDAQAVVNGHTDTFLQTLKVCAKGSPQNNPAPLLTHACVRNLLFRPSQATHARLSDEIDRGLEPSPHSHTVHASRVQSQLVGLRASLMSSHLKAMLAQMDRQQ